MSIRPTSHARYDLWYHVAFSTKYRKKIWTDPVTCQRVADISRTIASHHDIEPGECKCLPDHLHLTMSVPPRIAGYFIRSVGPGLTKEEIERSIDEQSAET